MPTFAAAGSSAACNVAASSTRETSAMVAVTWPYFADALAQLCVRFVDHALFGGRRIAAYECVGGFVRHARQVGVRRERACVALGPTLIDLREQRDASLLGIDGRRGIDEQPGREQRRLLGPRGRHADADVGHVALQEIRARALVLDRRVPQRRQVTRSCHVLEHERARRTCPRHALGRRAGAHGDVRDEAVIAHVLSVPAC